METLGRCSEPELAAERRPGPARQPSAVGCSCRAWRSRPSLAPRPLRVSSGFRVGPEHAMSVTGGVRPGPNGRGPMPAVNTLAQPPAEARFLPGRSRPRQREPSRGRLLVSATPKGERRSRPRQSCACDPRAVKPTVGHAIASLRPRCHGYPVGVALGLGTHTLQALGGGSLHQAVGDFGPGEVEGRQLAAPGTAAAVASVGPPGAYLERLGVLIAAPRFPLRFHASWPPAPSSAPKWARIGPGRRAQRGPTGPGPGGAEERAPARPGRELSWAALMSGV